MRFPIVIKSDRVFQFKKTASCSCRVISFISVSDCHINADITRRDLKNAFESNLLIIAFYGTDLKHSCLFGVGIGRYIDNYITIYNQLKNRIKL